MTFSKLMRCRLIAVVACVMVGAATNAFPGETRAVTVGAPGNGPIGLSQDSVISGDGRYVAYTSGAPDIVVGDTNVNEDIFLYDRQTGATIIVSRDTAGVQTPLAANMPSISYDGRYVAYSGNHLTAPGSGSRRNIHVRDTLLGTLTNASVNTSGVVAFASCDRSVISANGRFVVFETTSSNLLPGDTDGWPDIYVKDMVTGTLSLASVNSSGIKGDGQSSFAKISDDGRYIAFNSSSTNLSSADTINAMDGYVHDRQTGQTTLVTVDQVGAALNSSFLSDISADGRLVTFSSSNPNIVPGDTNNASDVFVRDLVTGTSTLVSLTSAGTQGNGSSGGGVTVGNGRYVAYNTTATNMVAGDTNENSDIFVRDLVAGTTVRASLGTANEQGNQSALWIGISEDASAVVFDTESTTLVNNDFNNDWDVYLRDLTAGALTRVSTGSAPSLGNGQSDPGRITGNGQFVFFSSSATNLLNPPTTRNRMFVRNMVSGTTIPVVTHIDLSNTQPVISGNEQSVYFTSNSFHLVASDTNGKWDIFAFDRSNDSITLISVTSDEIQGNGDSFSPAASSDGRFVAFISRATNLVSSDTNGTDDVFVRDTLLGTTSRISVPSTGQQADGTSAQPMISADGRYIGFSSTSTNFPGGDNYHGSNVYVHDQVQGTTTLVDTRLDGSAPARQGEIYSMSADGRFIAFVSSDGDLVNGDTNQTGDTFVRDMLLGATYRVGLADNGSELASGSRNPVLSADGRYCTFETSQAATEGDINLILDVFIRDRKLATTYLVSRSSSGVQADRDARAHSISADGKFVVFSSQSTKLVPEAKKRSMYDLYRHEIAPPLTLTLSFTNWLGANLPASAQYVIRTAAGVVKYTGATEVAADGKIEVPRPVAGNYELLIKSSTFLRKKLSFVQTAATMDLGLLTLSNGDIVDDNVVDIADYVRLAGAFSATPASPNWDERADLNGDLIVDIGDYTILAQNFSQVGED